MAGSLKLLTTEEVSKMYPVVPKQTLANMRGMGTGPVYYKLGAKVVYRIEDIETWILSGRVEPKSAAA